MPELLQMQDLVLDYRQLREQYDAVTRTAPILAFLMTPAKCHGAAYKIGHSTQCSLSLLSSCKVLRGLRLDALMRGSSLADSANHHAGIPGLQCGHIYPHSCHLWCSVADRLR